MQRPSPSAVHEWQGNQGHANHDGSDTHCCELCRFVRQARRGEQRGGVVEYLR